jgi:proline iminopeptidase
LILAAMLCCLPATGLTAAEGSFAVTEDGVRVYYETVGTGMPIVMIAGGPGASSASYRRTHVLLRPYGQLVFLDNRGRGRSEDVGDRPNAYTLDNDVLDVEAVRKALGADRVIVFGHSYGSMVAMAYAGRYPRHTAGLITTAGTHGARVWQERNIDGVKRFLQSQYPKRWARIVGLHRAGRLTSEPELAELFDKLDELYTYDPENKKRVLDQFEEYRDPKSITFNPDVYRMLIGDDPEWTLSGTLRDVELLPELSNYQGPALIMGGRYDRICPPINQVEIARALAQARLVIFEKSAHSPAIEEPLRFLTVVSDFLRQARGARD